MCQLKQKEAGFTLIEMLVVLTIFMTLVFITAPVNTNVQKELKVQQFFSLFEQDVLWMQNQAITKNEIYRLHWHPDSHKYEIRQSGLGKLMVRRNYSSEIEVELKSFQLPFSFYPSGAPNQPGVLLIHTEEDTFQVTFPLGKGRFYVTKTST
ncbi:type II secretion system protein [Virgibacillus sp. MSP4-1]|uniref:competence type IV pilus minor pilin ComGD n=1 Tax=Virgibacillus sp. MSP4-1 TaxID=2700081 RepID=UPI0003999291|nr:competence type IV pilus minor pilin ComGD [Virgibacillus sp. MSP4-1]QHS22746.1 type II secretion system protein [Virgibacillus sp. MSP4-1]